MLGVSNVGSITDGRRTVNYSWTPTGAEHTTNSQVLLTDVEHPDGTHTQYTYGETVEGNATHSYYLTGVINEENNRFLTYKRIPNSSSQIIAEWKGAFPDGIGGLGRLDLSTYGKIVDQDGREFSYTPAGNTINKPTGYTTPCPECIGVQGKTLVYSSINNNRAGNLIEIRDWKNQKTTFAYDLVGRMTERKEAVGTSLQRTTNWTYPAEYEFREPLTMTEQVKDAVGIDRIRTTTYSYSNLTASYPASSPCSGAHGGVSVPCDATRRLLTEVSVAVNDGSAARSWLISYDSYGLMDTLTDPMGRVSKYTWTLDGQLASMTRAYGTSIAKTTVYGGHTTEGPTWQQDESGLYTRWTRDLRGRILREDVGTPGVSGIGATDPDGTWPASLGGNWRSTFLEWRATGLLSEATLPDGRKLVFGYDTANRLTSMTGKTAGGTTLWTRNLTLSPAGALFSDTTVNAAAQTELTQSYTYNAIRQVASVVDANNKSTTVGYDANFMENSLSTPLGHANSNTFDALKRPTTFTDALNGVASLSYGPQDEVRSATDAKGVTTTYAYNGHDDLVGIASPDRGAWTFVVNKNGEATQITDPRGVVITQSFDSLGRATNKTFDDSALTSSTPGFSPGSHIQTFNYDSCSNGTGRLCGFSDASGTTSYSYNEWGDMVGKAWSGAPGGAAGGVTLSTGYGFDIYGRLTSIVYPSGKVLARGVGTDGDTESLSYDGQAILSEADWTSYGAIKGWTWDLPGLSSGQTHVAYNYDQNGQIQSIDDLDSRDYILDDDKRITGVDDPMDVSKSQVYGYDALSRLNLVDIGAWPGPVGYEYDAVGNRTSKNDISSGTGFTYTYGVGGTHNRLLGKASTIGGVPGTAQTVSYDPMGSMIQDGAGLSLSYDATGRLVESAQGATTGLYAYNALGKRVQKTVAGSPAAGTTLFAYDETGQLLGSYSLDSGAPGGFLVQEEIIWLDEWRPVATIRPHASLEMTLPEVHPILTDHLGTPRKIMNPVGYTVWSWDAKEPFGMQAPNQNPSSQGDFIFHSRFPGQWFDEESGLYHNGFRDFSPSLGRYVQSDPIGLEAGWNTYGYVNGNPLYYIDSDGLRQRTTRNHMGAGGNSHQRRIQESREIRDALQRSGATPFPGSPRGDNVSSLDNQSSLLEHLTNGEYEEWCVAAACQNPQTPNQCGRDYMQTHLDWTPRTSPLHMPLFGCSCIETRTTKSSQTNPQPASGQDTLKFILKMVFGRK